VPGGKSPADIPIVVWLQGGPGTSSMLANFFEVGSYQLKKDKDGQYKESPSEYAWTDYFHLLAIDNPRGTGYSIADKGSYLSDQD